MEKNRDLLESARSIDRLDYSVLFPKLAREAQRLSSLSESGDLVSRKMRGLVDEASRSREGLSELKKRKID